MGIGGITVSSSGTIVNTVYSAPLFPGGGIGSQSSTSPLPQVFVESSAAIVEFPDTPTVTFTFSPSPTYTIIQIPTPTQTCPMPCMTPPFFLVDRNIFNPAIAETVNIIWNFGTADDTHAVVYNSAGELIQKLNVYSCFNGSLLYATWDGRNYNGNIVTNNVYVIQVIQGQFLRYAKVAIMKGARH